MGSHALVQRLESLGKLHKLGILLLLVLLSAGSYAFFSLMPNLEHMATLRDDIDNLETTIDTNRRLAARLPEVEAQMAEREYDLLMAKMLLPEDVQERERLLAGIERLGMDVGVEFLLFQPGGEVKHDFYASREVQLRMRGEFHNLMTFFDRMARLDRLVSLDRLGLQPSRSSGQVILTAESTIQVYRALSQAEIEAAQEAEKNPQKKQSRRR